MLVHIIGSMRNFDEDASFMQKIADTVRHHGSCIALDWFSAVKNRKQHNSTNDSSLNWPELVRANIDAASSSDAMIIEGSRFNYSQGYQTALALSAGKPVLNLYRKNLKEYKEWTDKFFVAGVANPLFTSKAYATEDDAARIVTKFLSDIEPTTRELDIKLTLNNEIYAQLDHIAMKTGRSKTSIIKDIVSNNIATQ
jgi:hypothetical protein